MTDRDPILETSEGIYLTSEDFEGLEALELKPYSGEGRMSYASKGKEGSYDIPKMEYLASLGIETNPEWLTEQGEIKSELRALFVTMFIVTGNILVTEDIRRTLGEDTKTFKEVLEERNRQLKESRLDKYGYRRVLPDGSRVEDHFESMSLSANPEKRVSEEELQGIVRYVFSRLKQQ